MRKLSKRQTKKIYKRILDPETAAMQEIKEEMKRTDWDVLRDFLKKLPKEDTWHRKNIDLCVTEEGKQQLVVKLRARTKITLESIEEMTRFLWSLRTWKDYDSKWR